MEGLHYDAGEVHAGDRRSPRRPSSGRSTKTSTRARRRSAPEKRGSPRPSRRCTTRSQTIPYELGRGNILTQLQLMRLFGALLGALTALLIFLFLREALPRRAVGRDRRRAVRRAAAAVRVHVGQRQPRYAAVSRSRRRCSCAWRAPFAAGSRGAGDRARRADRGRLLDEAQFHRVRGRRVRRPARAGRARSPLARPAALLAPAIAAGIGARSRRCCTCCATSVGPADVGAASESVDTLTAKDRSSTSSATSGSCTCRACRA